MTVLVVTLLVVGALVVAVLAGAAATLGLARVTDRVWLVLVVGGLVEIVVAAAGLALAFRRSPGRRRMVAATAAALLAVSAVAVLVPLPDPRLPPPDVSGQQRWQLPSGSSIRYVHLPARGEARPTPVVFLHGGPGIADMAGDAAFFGRLAADGYDVYVYDQVGAGGSSRLNDPTAYTVRRDVADLEQIRRRVGARSMILIGHSYGAALAAHYLAAHPERVARMAVISPGPLDPADTSSSRATAGLEAWRTLRMYGAALTPRALLGYALLQMNPEAAHAYLDDPEADARNDTILTVAEPALHCPGRGASEGGEKGRADVPGGDRGEGSEEDQGEGRGEGRDHRVRGSGFYRLQYPQSAAAPPVADVRDDIDGRRTPTLILKGECDYLSWSSALDYTAALPRSTLVYFPGAGHNLYQDRPGDTLRAIRAFLARGRLPAEPYRDRAAPPGYQGPP